MARNATCEGASILRCVFALMMSCALGCGPEPAEPEADEPINEQSEYDEISVPLTCEGIESDQDCVEPADNALRLDAEDRLGFEAITFDRDNMAILMRLKPGASLPERIKVGAPIYRARKDRKPFMAIVEQVDRRGDEVRVKVRPAKLKEVFKRGRIRAVIPHEIDPAEAAMQAMEDGPTEEAADMQRRLQGLTNLFDVRCETTLLDERIAGSSYNGKGSSAIVGQYADIKVELSQCGVTFKGDLYADLDWGGPLGTPDKFEFSVSAGLELALEASASLTLDKDNAFPAFLGIYDRRLLKLPSLSVPIGGLPFSITPSIYGGIIVDTNTDLAASAGFIYDAQATLGFVWNAGNGVSDLSNTSSTFTKLGPEFSQAGDATVQVYLRPELELSVIGILKGSAGLQGYVEINSSGVGDFNDAGEFEGEVCYDLDAGFNPVVGLDIFAIVDKKWKLKGKSYNLADGCISDDTVEPLPACGPSDECVLDSDCIGPEVTSCSVYKCSDNCTCKVLDRPGCCTSSSECDDGDPSTLDTCEVSIGFCRSAPIAGYCASDDDCDDGVAVSEDTCVNNRCKFETAKSSVGVLGPERECFSHGDCDDGVAVTTDTCEGRVCYNRTTVIEESRCFDDADCDDGAIFTSDTCNAIGECVYSQAPGFKAGL